MAIRRFIRRASEESGLSLRSIEMYECEPLLNLDPGGFCTVVMEPSEDLDDVGTVHVCFRRLPGEGWRFRFAETGWEVRYRTISDLLYHH